MSTPLTQALPHETIWSLTNAVVPSRCLHAAAELGVADLVAEAPVPPEHLAAQLGLEPAALDRALLLLATHGVFARRPEGYVHTEASRLLRTDHPRSMRAFARMMGLPVFHSALGEFEHSLRTGRPALERVAPDGLWPYLEANPEQAAVFGRAMTAKAAGDIAAIVGAYDFRQFATVADIGGGRGHLLGAVLSGCPDTRGILFDLPPVVATVEVTSDRLTLSSGDFFVDPLPSADCYVLMDVIHDWADAEAVAILRAVHRAAQPAATVLIVEDMLSDGPPDQRSQTLDVVMLYVTGGRERTPSELQRLLAEAGFGPARLIETQGSMCIVEAAATGSDASA